jgi:GNAT superfamily N-acetyltransferase
MRATEVGTPALSRIPVVTAVDRPDNGCVTIRLLGADELTTVQQIENAAGRPFAEIGMHEIAADAPPDQASLEGYQADGRAWVLVDDQDVPIGFVLVDLVDSGAHIEQVSIHPDHARNGLGRTLIDHVAGWAREQQLDELTLTTFTEVAWNGPYYSRLGFVAVPPAELGPQLRAIREHEAAIGLDRWPRTAMRRPL